MRYVIVGLGTFGRKMLQTLDEHGAEVIAIDRNAAAVEAVKDRAAIALTLDSTHEEAMRAAQIDDVDAAIVALGEAQEQAILTTAILKKMGIYPIIARAANAQYAHVLKLVGADQVVVIEEQVAEDIAKQLLAPGIHERVFLATGHSLVELEARKEFIGKTLNELEIRKRFGVNVIAIKRIRSKVDEDGKVYEDVEINDLPGSEDVIEEGDVLVIVGAETDIQNLALSK
ncbi:MAG TPA: TrkA family potassium uptake protein [bacterium]|nr:TrkA family potassium uptake protein [bacterium]